MTDTAQTSSPSDFQTKAGPALSGGILAGRHTLVWLALIAVTAASWAMGHGITDTRIAGAAVLILAFIKTRLVIREFMEVREAPLILRIITDLWVGGATILLVGMWLFAGRTA